MPDATKSIARIFSSVFAAMREQANGGKERFGDWIYRIVDRLAPVIARAYAHYLAEFQGVLDKDDIASVAHQRAIETARSVCETTSNWLQEGRDVDVVFSRSRVAMCAIAETSYAINTAKLVACKQQGKLVRWKLGGINPCKRCRELSGRTQRPGKPFQLRDGTSVIGPPLHPNCLCRVMLA